VFAVGAAAGVAWLAYQQWTLTPVRRTLLVGLRFTTLLLLLIFLMRPVARTVDVDARDAVVPILVDVSRSMGIEDVGARRIDYARQLVTDRLLPALGSRFQVEVLAFGESLAPMKPAEFSATARRSDLAGALAAVRDRYRGRAIAGIVLVSDGGDTSATGERAAAGAQPIFPIGIGSVAVQGDREILSVTVAESVLDDSRVDLAVSAVSHGLSTAPIELRLLENGRPIDVRRAAPTGDGTPVREVFQVSPGRGAATVYTVEIPVTPEELVPENNVRSTLVQPPARPRLVLLVEGAPGFEHSFLKRAWASDQGLEIDSVVRKGKNELGADTFYIQAARSRSDSLTAGYPSSREALFQYDALVLANVEAHQLTRAQLESTRAFVAERGGGLLVLGARSFVRQGLTETALEEVLPLDLHGRGGGVMPATSSRGSNRVTLTADGDAHPMMQLAATAAETRRRWEEVPALASIAPLGGPRPGASVLAVTSGAGGAPRALVAVQRFGDGRAMLFAGEAAWRWRMLRPASDRDYETFWRQAVRWLAVPASDPVAVSIPPGAAPADKVPVRVVVRNAAFQPQPDAVVDVRVTAPSGRLESLRAAPDADAAGPGRFVAQVTPNERGVYRVAAEARRGATALGTASTSLLVGGADVEMTDPRRNDELLRRVAQASGGRLLSEDQLSTLPSLLEASVTSAALAVRRDLWHTKWSFAAVVLLLGIEWTFRRRWGLR
jgi:uncharacterized membrane protein